MDGVTGDVQGPFVSDDGVVAQTIVTFNFGKNGWNDLPDTADALRNIAQIDGVTVNIAGQGGQAADSAEVFAGVDGTLLFSALGIVILILLFTYRSPVLWILPIFCAVVALFTTEALIYFLAKYADSPSTARARASSPCWSSAPAPTTRCCSSPDIARSCAVTRTATMRWPSRCTAPPRRSWRAPPPSRSACSA